VIVLADIDFEFRGRFLDGAEGLDHQHRMMGHDRASPFVHDGRMRDAFGIAHVHNVPDDVVRVFLKGIIRRAVEIAPRSIVINSEPAADVEIAKLMAELAKLRVVTGRFAHRPFNRGNVRHLRPDMKMNELETMPEASRFQHLTRRDEAGGIEPELCVLAAARRPFAGAFAV
jgi:hypothetical protein